METIAFPLCNFEEMTLTERKTWEEAQTRLLHSQSKEIDRIMHNTHTQKISADLSEIGRLDAWYAREKAKVLSIFQGGYTPHAVACVEGQMRLLDNDLESRKNPLLIRINQARQDQSFLSTLTDIYWKGYRQRSAYLSQKARFEARKSRERMLKLEEESRRAAATAAAAAAERVPTSGGRPELRNFIRAQRVALADQRHVHFEGDPPEMAGDPQVIDHCNTQGESSLQSRFHHLAAQNGLTPESRREIGERILKEHDIPLSEWHFWLH
jgi:hypothetical protein